MDLLGGNWIPIISMRFLLGEKYRFKKVALPSFTQVGLEKVMEFCSVSWSSCRNGQCCKSSAP